MLEVGPAKLWFIIPCRAVKHTKAITLWFTMPKVHYCSTVRFLISLNDLAGSLNGKMNADRPNSHFLLKIDKMYCMAELCCAIIKVSCPGSSAG